MEKPKTGVVSNNLEKTPVLKNKVMYIATNLSKNIQVVDTDKNYASYALYQEEIPISLKGYDVFLLITSFGKKSLDVVSLTDDKIIKTIDFKTQPEEIVIDNKNKIAYISSGEDASLYVVSLETMTIKKQIRLNGMCEKIILSDDGTKLLYNDKQTREVWAIELDNNYLMKEIGKFSNVSKLAYINGKVYITSRTKNYLAIIDYETNGLMSGNPIAEKPVDMITYNDNLFVLGAGSKTIDVVDTSVDQIIKVIELPNHLFPTKFFPIEGSNLVMVTDSKADIYSIIDLEKMEVRFQDDQLEVYLADAGGVNNETVAFVSNDNVLHVKNCKTRKEQIVREDSMKTFLSTVFAKGLALSDDGKYVAMNCIDYKVRVYDLEEEKIVSEIPFGGRSRAFIEFTPDSKNILLQGDDYYLQVYNMEKQAMIQTGSTQLFTIDDVEYLKNEDGEIEKVVLHNPSEMYLLTPDTYDVTTEIINGCDISLENDIVMCAKHKEIVTFPYYSLDEMYELAKEETKGEGLSPEQRVRLNVD
jgi:DNA-binding beta-propeller fold protein YncE